MAVKFLDKTGLGYFWGKIKAWCNATFAAITHSHAWSTITGKPTTISGYGITDAKISNGAITLGSNSITPLTSHQDISGKVNKSGDTMTGDLIISRAVPGIYTKSTSMTRNTAPSANVANIEVCGLDNANNRTWSIYHTYSTTKAQQVQLICYKGTTTDYTWSGIGVGYDASGNWFTNAPTPATSDNSTKIATTAFVKAQGYITSSGSITGSAAKLGTSTVGASNNPIYLNAGVPTATSITLAKTIQVGVGAGAYSDMLQTLQSDNNNYRSCTIRCENGNGYNSITLGAHDEKNNAPAGINIMNKAGVTTVEQNSYLINGSMFATAYTDRTRGGTISAWAHRTIYFGDKYVYDNRTISDDHTFGWIRSTSDASNTIMEFLSFRNTSANNGWGIKVIAPTNTNSDCYATLTSSPVNSDNSTKIATTAFVKAQGYLTSLNGILKNTINLATISTKPSSDTFKTIWECYSKDNKIVADSYVARDTSSDGWTAVVLRSRCSNGTNDENAYAYLHLWCNKDGSDKYVTFPTPGTSSNSDTGATTAWVRTFCDTTQKYMKAVSVTGSGNAVTAASLSNGTLTLTKGTTFLTSHQSLDSCVKTSGDQTINGTKTFNYRIMGTLGFKHTGINPSSNPSSNQYCTICTVENKNGDYFNEIYTGYLTNGENSTVIRTWRKDRSASNSWFVNMPDGVSRGYSYGNLYKDMVFINNNADLGTKPSSTEWWSLAFQDKDGESFGGAWFNASTGGACEYVIRCNTNLASGGVTKSIWIYQNQDKTSAAGVTADTFRPTLKTFAKLGDIGDSRWGQIYSTSSTISTSDERQKCDIETIPDDILDAWESCEFYQYKMKDSVNKKGDNARYHTGMIAQRLDAKFKAVSKSLNEYGLFCYDEWDASEARLDENGNITEPAIEAGNEYSIRYEEALCMEAAYQRRKNKILENRISELETQVQNMLQVLESLKGA